MKTNNDIDIIIKQAMDKSHKRPSPDFTNNVMERVKQTSIQSRKAKFVRLAPWFAAVAAAVIALIVIVPTLQNDNKRKEKIEVVKIEPRTATRIKTVEPPLIARMMPKEDKPVARIERKITKRSQKEEMKEYENNEAAVAVSNEPAASRGHSAFNDMASRMVAMKQQNKYEQQDGIDYETN